MAKQRETEIIEQINDWRSDRHDYFTALVKYEKLVLKFFPEEQNYLRDIKKSSYKVIQISKDLIYLPQQHYLVLLLFSNNKNLNKLMQSLTT